MYCILYKWLTKDNDGNQIEQQQQQQQCSNNGDNITNKSACINSIFVSTQLFRSLCCLFFLFCFHICCGWTDFLSNFNCFSEFYNRKWRFESKNFEQIIGNSRWCMLSFFCSSAETNSKNFESEMQTRRKADQRYGLFYFILRNYTHSAENTNKRSVSIIFQAVSQNINWRPFPEVSDNG